MKIIEVKTLALPEVKLIKFSRFPDERGYFTETFRQDDLLANTEIFPAKTGFTQVNESYSKANVLRGLHFQWSPKMGKLVRCIQGRLIDIALDIRLNSPTFGKAIMCDLPGGREKPEDCWVWVPPGFAHGTLLTEESLIEYFCTGQYNPNSEDRISPLAEDIDWSLAEPELKNQFDAALKNNPSMTDQDRNGYSLAQWQRLDNAKNFVYGQI